MSSSPGISADGTCGGAVVPGDSPDPRWPLLKRWSQSSPSVTPPPQSTVGSPACETSAAKSTTFIHSPEKAPRLSPSPAMSPRIRPSPLLGSSSLKITDFFSKSKSATSTVSPNLEAPTSEVIGETLTVKGVKESEAGSHIPFGTPSPAVSDGKASKEQLHRGSPSPDDTRKLDPNVSSSPVQPSLRGAWAKQLNFTNLVGAQQSRRGAPCPKTSHSETSKEDVLRFPWAAKMDPAARNLYRATTPEYLEDGTPKVTIPSLVMMQGLENQKEYVLGQFYRCSLPPGGLVHAVVNRIWGRKCRIFSRKLSDRSFIFHIPDASTRAWVLQRGLWHVDDCLMFVAPWSTAETFDIPEIKTIPVWVTLKNIPHRLYSIPGISHIASGLGTPMATYKPRLDPSLMGEAKILVEVELSKAFPPRIAAADKNGNIFMVNVEYSWILTNCGECGQLGHKASRCTKPVLPQEGVPNPSIIFTPVIMDSEVIVDTTLDIETAPIQEIETSRVAECHTIVEATVVTDSVSNAGIGNAAEANDAILTEREESIVLAGNRFSRLGSSFSDGHQSHSDGDSSVSEDSDNEFDLMVSMSPSGQRILRERPVQPSIKAKETQASTIARGRGSRGRGHRGRRGHGNGGRG